MTPRRFRLFLWVLEWLVRHADDDFVELTQAFAENELAVRRARCECGRPR